MSDADRRRFPRLSLDVELRYGVLHKGSAGEKEARGKNISAGGVCMVILEKLEVGTLMKLEFSLQDSEKPIVAKGRIMWIEENDMYSTEIHRFYDCGIEFVDIRSQDQKTITQLVMRLLKKD